LALVWCVIAVAIGASIWVARTVEFGRYRHGPVLLAVALALFAIGVALRASAIVVLGRFFTVDVAIHADHELVRRGPYRVLRHPSYTGALLVFFGLALLFDSWPALAVATLPVLGVLLWRIRVEERALSAHFGKAWLSYAARTQRLVPFVW
jgi:protein-S-isoprenylcysteine O-methyltransferase